MLHNAELSGKKVNPKVLIPIFEYSAREETEDVGGISATFMQEKWAALLANAGADIAEAPDVPPSFPEILRQLSARECLVIESVVRSRAGLFTLDLTRVLYDRKLVRCEDIEGATSRAELAEKLARDREDHAVIIDGLIRLRLLEKRDLSDQGLYRMLVNGEPVGQMEEHPKYFVTALARQFVSACQAPKPAAPKAN